jgi:hypothetical protein
MTAFAINPPYPFFAGIDGDPLDNGKVYVGVANLDPVANPVALFWDEALTIAASQPILTSGGYPVRNGSPSAFYTASGVVSMTVKDAVDVTVYTEAAVTNAIASLAGPDGSSLVGYTRSESGAVARTVQAVLRDTISVKDFGAVGDGAADDTAAFVAWIAALNAATTAVGGVVPSGSYRLNSATLAAAPLTITREVHIYSDDLATITMFGASVVTAMFKVTNTGAVFSGLNLVGNNQGTTYTNGSAIFFEQTALAASDMLNCRVADCRFDNFKTPFWVYFLSQSATRKISGYGVTGCRFTSRAGNSIDPTSIAMNASFICAYGEETVGGTVQEGLIADNLMDATYVKSGIQLFHGVRRTLVRGNVVQSAGVSGANDDKGAYAIWAYSDDGEATDNQIIDNVVLNARSIGIYIRGENERMAVIGNTVTVVPDVQNGTLPKGGICILAATDFVCANNTATLCSMDGFYFIPSATLPTKRALFSNNSAQGCGTVLGASGYGFGIRLVGANAVAPNVEVRGFTASECRQGIGVSLFDSGGFSDLVLSDFTILSAVTGSYGVFIFTNETLKNLPRAVIGGASKVKAVVAGIDAAGIVGKGVISGVDLVGPFTARAINIDNSTIAIGDGVTIRGQTFASGGFALGTAGQQGGIADSLRFIDCDDTALVAISGTDGGVNAPVFAATKNEFVKRLLPVRTAAVAPLVGAFYTVRGWRLVDTGWVECRELCA